MQKTQNVDIQRVMNLVDFYRTKVRESDASKDAQMEYEDWYEFGVDQTQTPNDAQWEWMKILCVNEQLLGHFYSVVAGDKAEKDILQQLLPEAYDTSIFTQEEEDFLKEHFKELVNYIIQTPDNVWSTRYGDNSEGKETFLIPEEVLELIKSRVNIPDNAVIYNPFAWFGQLATLFKSNTVLWGDDCDLYGHALKLADSIRDRDTVFHQRMLSWMKAWVWARIAMYANNVNAQIMGGEPLGYDVLITSLLVPYLSNGNDYVDKVLMRIHEAYNHLKEDGKMVLLCPRALLSSQSISETLFREQLVKDGSIAEIIQLPSVMNTNLYHDQWCLIIVDKERIGEDVTLIDARIASDHLDTLCYSLAFNQIKFNAILQNDGRDPNTGLRKVVKVPLEDISPDILVPHIYTIERPLAEEQPVPLSTLCSIESTLIHDVQYNLPEQTPWIKDCNLTPLFSEVSDMSMIEKANCPNNPKDWHWGDKKLSKFMLGVENSVITSEELRISEYRNSWFLDGNQDAVLYKYVPNQGLRVALIRKTGNPIAIDSGIAVFVPNEEVDAMSLVAILQMPIVYRQIQAYKEFGLKRHLCDILVPTSKRVVLDEVRRLEVEREAYKAQKEKFESMKTEYINEVRMRKHDMGQYVFELINIEDLMRYYMENRDKEKDFCQQIEGLLDNFKASIGELSTLLDNLSKEEEFGEPERFDVHEFLSHLEERHKTEGYAIKYECDMVSIIDYNFQKKDELDDFLLDEQMDEYARTQQEIDDYLLEQEEEDARIQQEIEDSLWENEAYVLEETQASDDESYVSEEPLPRDDNSYVAGDTQDDDEPCVVGDDQIYDDEPCVVGDDQVVDEEPYVIDGLWGKYLCTIPSLYVAPNDIQRLVNNILDNARKHGFTDHERSDYEVDVKLSINTETQMFQIDFRNNGNPLPEGMDKTRYGIKGEKAGATGGTGIGGSFVKKCVEHYGGDYNIFMEDGWTIIPPDIQTTA